MYGRTIALLSLCVLVPRYAAGQVPRFTPEPVSLELSRAITPDAFFDVVGRRAAVFGYEDRPFEAWVYPLKVLDDFSLGFSLEGYPLEIAARDIISRITVRPEATTITYSHAAFTVKETILVPADEPGVIVLLDIDTTLPIHVTASFRPRLRLMWPAGSMTPNAGFDAKTGRYTITEETRRFAAIIGSPDARDLSLMPYQEEPRDVPVRFVRELTPEEARRTLVPIVIAGSTNGAAEAQATYDRLLSSAPALYAKTALAYRQLLDRTTDLQLPDERLVTAFRWAKVGIDKGLATNPGLGTGLLAGFRTSGDSERPGFAWFFGRDALWTALAIDAEGDFATARTALDFLTKYQRADGKIPHEISQSAALVPWFDAYNYPWASADATPLFIVAHADYYRATGDRAFIAQHWNAIVKAFKFTAATDTDGNHLVENTKFGHGWVEGGALYPPHEEIYLQGVWIAALNGLAELAGVMGDSPLASDARARADQTRRAVEERYWLADRGYYAFATGDSGSRLIAEDTVLPAVPLWWGLLQADRAQSELDHVGAGDIATDWGARILSSKSSLYDPLSYHYGSVWPLFTGWAAMAAYRYGRPHVGYQALMANALLTEQGALGYVTELLSGAFNAPFGRSSHHQIWSEAMVVTPLVRGLLGIDVSEAGRVVSLRPQLPADWDRVAVHRIAAGSRACDATFTRGPGSFTVDVAVAANTAGEGLRQVIIAPAFPLDARVRAVRVDGRAVRPTITPIGDVQFAEIRIDSPGPRARVEFSVDDGSDVYVTRDMPPAGERSQDVRVLRSHAGPDGLRLTLEGRGGRTYTLALRTMRRVLQPSGTGVKIERTAAQDPRIQVTFEGAPDQYVRREVLVPLGNR
jgi:glycogen debranching enzyme